MRIPYTIRVWRLFTAISRKVVGKSRQSPKVLWVVWSALFFKEIWKNVTGCLRCYVCDYWRKATKAGSTAAVASNSVLIISHITFRDCRVHIFSDNLSRNNCIRNSKWDYMHEIYFKDLDYIRPQKFYHLLYSLCMVSSKHLYWFSLVLVSFISFPFLFFYCPSSPFITCSMHKIKKNIKIILLIYWTTDEAEPQQIKYLHFLLIFSPSLTRCIFPITTNFFISESFRQCINLLLQCSSPNLLDKIGFWASLSFSLGICHFLKNLLIHSEVSGAFLHVFHHWL